MRFFGFLPGLPYRPEYGIEFVPWCRLRLKGGIEGAFFAQRLAFAGPQDELAFSLKVTVAASDKVSRSVVPA